MNIAGKIGSILSPTSRSRKAVLRTPKSRSRYGIVSAGTRTSKNQATKNMQAAVSKYQTKVGGAALGVAGIGMMTSGRSSSSQRGGYSPPRLREPRGSGRYA
jgi:hypothetical protein